MGFAAARLPAVEGAYVYITGRRKDRLDQAVQAIEAIAPGAVTGVQADSGSPADLDRLFAAVRDRHGRVDIVYASAGIGSVTEPLEAVTTASFDDVVRPHLDGGAAGRGIRVNLISPGPIDTATFDGIPAESARRRGDGPGRPVRDAGGDRRGRAVPGLGRLQLHPRHRAVRRRRPRPGLTSRPLACRPAFPDAGPPGTKGRRSGTTGTSARPRKARGDA
jgi:NAD(P)-dependent dehydrogenase (short-subunit alcohol dehydrogenase family)